VVVHICNLSIREAEAGTSQVLGQPGLHREQDPISAIPPKEKNNPYWVSSHHHHKKSGPGQTDQ
jgi:hypothetical protein